MFGRDVKRNVWFYLAMAAELLICLVLLALFSGLLVPELQEQLADDESNYSGCVATAHVSGDAEDFAAYLNGLSEGISLEYGLFRYDEIDYRPLTEKEYRDGISKAGTVIDEELARRLKLNNVTGDWFSESLPDGYREVLVSEEMRDVYRIGEFYDDSNLGRIKVIGYLRNGVGLSPETTRRVSAVYGGFVLADDVSPNVSAQSDGSSRTSSRLVIFSPFDGEELPPFYEYGTEEAGLSFRPFTSFEDAYDDNSYRDALFMVAVADIIFMLTMATNIVINKRRTQKTNACYFLCGATTGQVVAFEFFRMALLFLTPFCIAMLLTPILEVKLRYILIAGGIVFVTYLIPQCIRVANLFTTNNLNILRGIQ